MKVKIHCKKFDTEFKMALYAMTEFAMARLVESKRLRNNIAIDVHFRHHSAEGEAMIDHHTNPYRPRHFRVIIDHHRLEKDNYGRTREVTEWAHEVLKTLAHELVHVKQYVVGDLSIRSKGMYWKGELTKIDNMMEYFKSPWEIEAYGLERYLWLNFIDFWKSNVEEHLEEKE